MVVEELDVHADADLSQTRRKRQSNLILRSAQRACLHRVGIPRVDIAHARVDDSNGKGRLGRKGLRKVEEVKAPVERQESCGGGRLPVCRPGNNGRVVVWLGIAANHGGHGVAHGDPPRAKSHPAVCSGLSADLRTAG